MARYFGGFRDRLKKRSKHLPITTKDVEWVKVATTFTWSPAKRDYQWLEPEDYLSSFLSSGDGQFDDVSNEIQGDGSIDAAMNLPFSGTEYDGSESLLSMPSSDEPEEEENIIGYIPPYDFVPEATPAFNDDAVLRPNIDVPADLPMLDEYKLEIVSALQRRGIKIDSSKIKLPEDLAAQVNGYHEGRVSIDSYELRARLQKYKRQVIESYEKFSAISGSINPESNGPGKSLYDEEAALDPPKSNDSNYESFILTSLNRLEASMNEDDLAFEVKPGDVSDDEVVFDFSKDPHTNNLEIPDILGADNYDVFDESNQTLDVRGAIRTTRHIETPPDTSDILAEGLTGSDIKNGPNEGELPSSYADDSWLVLPVDSRKAGQDLENPDDLDNIGELDGIGEDTLVVDILGASSKALDFGDEEEEEEGTLESNRADSSELLKALNTINSRFPESSSDTDAIELTTDFVDLEVEALNDSPEPITQPESPAEPEQPVLDKPDDALKHGNAPDVASLQETPQAPADETSLSELLLQLRHEGDRTVLDDVNVPEKSDSSDAADEKYTGEGIEADPIIGIEPDAESISLEDIDSASVAYARYIEHDEPAIVPEPPVHPDVEEIKPVSLDLEKDLPVAPETAQHLADEAAQIKQDAVDEPSLDQSRIPAPDAERLAFEKHDVVSPAPEASVPEDYSNTSTEETVEQSRARFIEEERKKLYSLIGDLEGNALSDEPAEKDGSPSAANTVPESSIPQSTVQGLTTSPDSLPALDPEKTEKPEALAKAPVAKAPVAKEPVAKDEGPAAKSALIQNIMAAKEQLGASAKTGDVEPPKITSRFAAKELIELSDELEETTPSPDQPATAPESNKVNAIRPEFTASNASPVPVNPVPVNPVPEEPAAVEPVVVEASIIEPEQLAGNGIPDQVEVDTTSNNIIDPEPAVQAVSAGEQITKEPNLDKKADPEAPPIVKGRSFGSLGTIEPAPLPRPVIERPQTPPPATAEPEITWPATSKPTAERAETQKQPVDKPSVREESLHNAPSLSSEANEPVFSSEPAAPGVEKITKPSEPSRESRVAVDQKAFKVNALVDQSSMDNERIVQNSAAHPAMVPADKSAKNIAEEDGTPLKSEKSGTALAGHNTESEQLRPVSIDKTFMSEPQTTEEETPVVSDVSPSKPVEIVTSPAPDVEPPTVVTVELDGVGVDKEEPLEEIVDEGLIEADEAHHPEVSLTHVIESLAFATEDPIPLKKIARIYSEAMGVKMPTEKKVRETLAKLNEEYTANGRSYRIKEWAGGVRMASHPQYARFIRALYKDNRPKKLSRTLMETLAIIAYSQPSTKPEIDFVRGVDSDYAVRKLLELGLIDIVGRSDSIGRPLLYGTSERFLEQFGLSGIEALPKLREVEELLGDPAFKKERLQLLALEDMDTSTKPSDEEEGEEPATDNNGSEQKPAKSGVETTEDLNAAHSVAPDSGGNAGE